MDSPKIKSFFSKVTQLMRIMILAYMIGIANIVNHETRMIEDSNTKIKHQQETQNDEPFEEVN